jgi:predicted transcriptional regulator
MISLTPLELAIMKSVWRRGRAQVREVQLDLLPGRDLAYTTVMTVLDRLFKKGVVRRAKKSRAHVYEAVYSEGTVRAGAVADLVENFFDGSEPRLMEYLSGEAPAPVPLTPQPSRSTPSAGTTIDDSLL